MDVAGEHHDIVDLRLAGAAAQRVVDPVAGRLVAVPLVAVDVVEAGVGRLVGAGRLELREHHALADQLPARRRRAQAVEQPRLLRVAEQRARRVGVGRIGRREAGAEDRRMRRGAELLRARADPLLEHQHLGEIAIREPAVVVARIRQVRLAHGHPLVVGLQRDRHPGAPQTFGARRVVLRAIRPRVVRGLVVIPDRDQRMLAVHRLRVRIALVLRVPRAVVGERDDLDRRLGRAGAAVLRGAVFVDVVAEVHHQVEVGAGGDAGIGVEVAVGMVAAAHYREAQGADRPERQGLRAADRALLPARGELVVVGRVRAQHREHRACVDLHRVVRLGAGASAAAHDDVAQSRVGRDDVAHQRRLRAGRDRDARPQDHAVVQWVAAGHAVLEHRTRGMGAAGERAGGGGCGSRTGRLEEVAARGHGNDGLDLERTTHGCLDVRSERTLRLTAGSERSVTGRVPFGSGGTAALERVGAVPP